MAKLINGNGNPAIYAAEDADLIASLAGNVTCIANVGNKYAATEEDATTIRLDDGVIITKEGRRIQLEAGESDTFYIPTGTSGQTNYYIIGYKLVQNADSTQVAEQFVQKMNSSTATITEDTFRGGATEVYVSLYRVTQVDFTITSITGLLPELLDSNSAKDDIAQINSDLEIEPIVDGLYYQNGHLMGNLKLVNNHSQITAVDTWCTFHTLASKYRPSAIINVPAVGYKLDGITPVSNCGIKILTDGSIQAHASDLTVWNINAVILPNIVN